jgi:hypothetical protein
MTFERTNMRSKSVILDPRANNGIFLIHRDEIFTFSFANLIAKSAEIHKKLKNNVATRTRFFIENSGAFFY